MNFSQVSLTENVLGQFPNVTLPRIANLASPASSDFALALKDRNKLIAHLIGNFLLFNPHAGGWSH